MSEKIKPALTAEEWRNLAVRRGSGPLAAEIFAVDGAILVTPDDENRTSCAVSAPGYHAAAALALYNQPFGFTREDVGMLRKVADLFAQAPREKQFGVDTLSVVIEPRIKLLRSLADRIEALLPPDL